MSIELLFSRLDDLEKKIKRANQTAPTFPIYDIGDLPQDAINGQIAIGIDGSINWFINDTWSTKPGLISGIGTIPQDILNGQVVVGLDDSLQWCVDNTWFANPGGICPSGNPPQDAIEGQIALNNDGIVWFSNGVWHGLI